MFSLLRPAKAAMRAMRASQVRVALLHKYKHQTGSGSSCYLNVAALATAAGFYTYNSGTRDDPTIRLGFTRSAQCDAQDYVPVAVGSLVLAGAAASYLRWKVSSDAPIASSTLSSEKGAVAEEVVREAIARSNSDLRRLYAAMDDDGDGDITIAEFTYFLEDVMGTTIDPMTMQTIDQDGDGHISYDEFVQMWAEHSRKMFQSVGPDGEGSVCTVRLSSMMPRNVPKEKADELLTTCDLDGNGKLTFDEFFLLINAQAEFQHAEGKRRRSMTPRARRMSEKRAARIAAASTTVTSGSS